MSDELEIRAGGAIAVDTATLRDAAGALLRAAAECAELSELLRRAGVASAAAGLLQPAPTGRAEQARELAQQLARELCDRADVYELIELDALRRSGTREGAIARLSGHLLALARPDLAEEADRVRQEWFDGRHREVERQLFGAVSPMISAIALLATATAGVRAMNRGVIEADAPPLTGTPVPTRVVELSRSAVTAPESLAQLAARMPGQGESRVRVEAYATAAGEREYVVYIAGTQSMGFGGDDPWDMGSNVELYAGSRSSSFDAVERAMAAAGAARGDRVHIVGHSQGAMLGTHLAREGGFDVATLITFASPVQAQLTGDVLSVTVRHSDDPVVALAVGGVPGIAGSRESFVAERVADPVPRPSDLAFGVHQMDVYRQTATLVDASDDPRVDALRSQLAGLGSATAATAVVYGAHRDGAERSRSSMRSRVEAPVSASSSAVAG